MRCQKNRSRSAREAQKTPCRRARPPLDRPPLRPKRRRNHPARLCLLQRYPRGGPSEGATKSCLSRPSCSEIHTNSQKQRAAQRCVEKMINRLLLCVLFLVISCATATAVVRMARLRRAAASSNPLSAPWLRELSWLLPTPSNSQIDQVRALQNC